MARKPRRPAPRPRSKAGSSRKAPPGALTKPKQAAAEPELEENWLREAFQTANIGIGMADAEERILAVNAKFCELLGYSRAELLRLHIFDLIHPDDLPESRRLAVLNKRREDQAQRGKRRYLCKDGSAIWVDVNTLAIRDGKGALKYSIGYVIDLTAQQQMKNMLRKSQEHFRLESIIQNFLLHNRDEKMYHIVLKFLLERFESRFGFFGYIRATDGALVCPSMTHDIWQMCAVQNKSIEFPRASWGGLWGRILIDRKPLLKNELHNTPKGHVPLSRSMGAPIMVDGELIGSIHVANRATDYTSGDLELLSHVCAVLAFPLRMRLLHEQSEIERRKAELELHKSSTQLRVLAGRLQAVREDERAEIAREIHDVLAQELTSIKIGLAWLGRRLRQPLDEEKREAMIEKLKAVTEQADVSIASVQKIATDLRPIVLDSLGLPAAIEWQVEEFERQSEIRCHVTVPAGKCVLSRERATALFRILQECLTNVVRHAGAAQVNVVLVSKDGHMELTVHDNGCGLAAEKLHDPRSIGLLGMRERVMAFGGNVEISGIPGAGTTVAARIPFNPAAEVEEVYAHTHRG